MAKIEWADLVKTDKPAVHWTLLCIIYLVANIVVQGPGNAAFAYTMVYTLAFLLIAVTISKATNGKGKTIGSLFAVMTLFVGMMTWITSGFSGTAAGAQTCMGIAIVFTAIAFLNEYDYIETKSSINNKYCLLGALGGIFLFGFLYFLHRLGIVPVGFPPTLYVGPLPWFTILNHLGITLLAGTDMLLIMGVGKWEKTVMYRWLFFGFIIIGVLGILQAGFGLAILR